MKHDYHTQELKSQMQFHSMISQISCKITVLGLGALACAFAAGVRRMSVVT